MKRLAGYFFKGLIFLVPIAITVYIFYVVFKKIDNLLGLPIPGAGFFLTIILVTIIGFLASNLFTKKLLNLVDRAFNKVPLIKLLYTATKDLLSAFLGDKRCFEKPVFVTLMAGTNVKVIGFITKESLASWGMIDEVVVYLPQSYNFAGQIIVVPKEQITTINANSSEVMAFIVSGGVSEIKR
ncbi:MAG: DUF502 domain-containing protein [Syntrophales bacterium]